MNRPPERFQPVAAAELEAFARGALERAGMPGDQATLLASLLVLNDLRGVFSHGTTQLTAYIGHFRSGQLTPTPTVRVVGETPTSITVDGDGGLGYFPALTAAHQVSARAREHGIAMGLTRNHGHIGAAGIYARIPLQSGLFAYVTSGHQLHLQPGQTPLHAAGGSPMSFALPTGEEPPFVLDFGAIHDMYPHSPHVEELIRLAPGTVLRSIGLGNVCQALGGFLAGVPLDPADARRPWPGANQGSFMIAVDPRIFMPLEQFTREMDAYCRAIRSLTPLTGFETARHAGEVEAEREAAYRERGIPMSPEQVAALRTLADDLELVAPF